MRVLVTGGCGYVGSVLVPQLQASPRVDEVVVVDSLDDGSPRNLLGARVDDGLAFRRVDVRNASAVTSAMAGVDGVVHLAALTGADSSHDRRAETVDVNLDGTRTVLRAARAAGVETVVLASSCNVYGRATHADIDETVTPEPINPYARSKLEAEQVLAEHVEDGAFDGTALRMSTNYGHAPGVRFNLVVNHFVFRALTGRPLTVYGDGSNWRPFIHVRDAARAFRHALLEPDAWSEHVYNVGAGDENYRIEDIATIVREEVDADLEVTYLEDEQPGPSYHVDFERLSRTGFETEVPLREGIRELAERFTGERREHHARRPLKEGSVHG